MMLRRFSDIGRRERLASKAPPGALRDFLRSPGAPPSTEVRELRLLAVDFETTGLDPASHHLLSVGFVPIDALSIRLSGARQYVVRAPTEVGQSAVVHGVTDDAVADGVDLEHVIDELLRALTGRVLLAHHAVIEQGFLTTACKRLYGVPAPCTTVDTMTLQRRITSLGWGVDALSGSLRLGASREWFGLPRYRAHEALTDALACAELFLAQVTQLSHNGPLTLKRLQRQE